MADFFLVGGEIGGVHRGTLKYLHQRVVEKAGMLTPREAGEVIRAMSAARGAES